MVPIMHIIKSPIVQNVFLVFATLFFHCHNKSVLFNMFETWLLLAQHLLHIYTKKLYEYCSRLAYFSHNRLHFALFIIHIYETGLFWTVSTQFVGIVGDVFFVCLPFLFFFFQSSSSGVIGRQVNLTNIMYGGGIHLYMYPYIYLLHIYIHIFLYLL